LPRARPPAMVRLQGLVTLLAVFALRPRAGSISHRQRSWGSPCGAFSSRKASGALHPDDPTCRFARRFSHRTRRWAGPTCRGFWDQTFREYLATWPVVSQPAAGCSLGFCLHQLVPERWGEGLTGIWVHLASCRALLPASRCSLMSLFALPQSPGAACGAEHSRKPLLIKLNCG
jgi:hypothetical protein